MAKRNHCLDLSYLIYPRLNTPNYTSKFPQISGVHDWEADTLWIWLLWVPWNSTMNLLPLRKNVREAQAQRSVELVRGSWKLCNQTFRIMWGLNNSTSRAMSRVTTKCSPWTIAPAFVCLTLSFALGHIQVSPAGSWVCMAICTPEIAAVQEG